MLEKLRKLNEKLLDLYREDEKNYEKQKIIKRILEEDKFIFKIDMETAYAILRDLTIKEEDLKKVYSNLINRNNFEK